MNPELLSGSAWGFLGSDPPSSDCRRTNKRPSIIARGMRSSSIRHVSYAFLTRGLQCASRAECIEAERHVCDFFAAVSPGCLAIRRKAPRQMRLRARRTGARALSACEKRRTFHRATCRRGSLRTLVGNRLPRLHAEGVCGARGALFHGRVNAGLSSPIQNNPR
jgi:hypothetical protein